MAVPTGYNEAEFSAYLETVLGHTATMLGWSAAAYSFEEVINETLLAMGETDIQAVTEIRQLRAIGRLNVWKAAANALAGDYDFSADGASYSRSQAFEHAQAMVNQAMIEAGEWDPQFSAVVTGVIYTEDPYENHDDYLSDLITEWEEAQ